MKTQLPITAADLLNRAPHVPAKIQRRFDSEVSRALNPEDSATGDRAIREVVADTFISVWLPRLL